jgi:hypothetical protein
MWMPRQETQMIESEARAQASEFLATIEHPPQGDEIPLLMAIILRAYHRGAVDACEELQRRLEKVIPNVKELG